MVFPAGFLGDFLQLAGRGRSNPFLAALGADAGRNIPNNDQRETQIHAVGGLAVFEMRISADYTDWHKVDF